jgi:hypothetical protein
MGGSSIFLPKRRQFSKRLKKKIILWLMMANTIGNISKGG